MEDKYYYKLRTIENDLKWVHEDLKNEGFDRLVPSANKRKVIREMMVNISRYAQSIQQKIGTEFRPEFEDAPDADKR